MSVHPQMHAQLGCCYYSLIGLVQHSPKLRLQTALFVNWPKLPTAGH